MVPRMARWFAALVVVIILVVNVHGRDWNDDGYISLERYYIDLHHGLEALEPHLRVHAEHLSHESRPVTLVEVCLLFYRFVSLT